MIKLWTMPRNYATQFFSWTYFSFVVRFSYKTSLLHQLATTPKIRSKEKYRTKIYFYKFLLSYIIIALRNIWIARIFNCIFLRIIISKLKSSGNKKLKGRNQKKTNCLKKLLKYWVLLTTPLPICTFKNLLYYIKS